MSGAAYQQFGDRDIRPVRVASATVIRIGDLLYLDTSAGQCKPASAFPWTTDLATTRANFAAKFLGVAASASASGDVTDVQVDVSPEALFVIGCIPVLFELGDMLTPAQDGANNALSSIVVEKTATVAAAIARVHVYFQVADSHVSCHFASAFVLHSGNKNALVGA